MAQPIIHTKTPVLFLYNYFFVDAPSAPNFLDTKDTGVKSQKAENVDEKPDVADVARAGETSRGVKKDAMGFCVTIAMSPFPESMAKINDQRQTFV